MESDPISESRRRCLGLLGAAATLVGLGMAETGMAEMGSDSISAIPAASGPPLWRLSPPPGAGGSGWLFGSIHAGLTADEAMPPAVERAWADADVLAIEIDVVARWGQLRDGFAAAALLPGADTLDTLIGAEHVNALREHFGLDDARWAGLRRLAPWALLAALAGEDPLRRRRTTAHGIETRFLESARRRAMPIVELEQAGEQVDALAGASLETQVAWLRRSLASMRQGKDIPGETLAAWRAGDEARLAALKTRAWGAADDRASPRERIFGERDRRIARRLAALLERPHRVFTLVGAFHLVGEDALPGILAEYGIRTDRVHHERGQNQR